MNFQPVIPILLNQDWNLISRKFSSASPSAFDRGAILPACPNSLRRAGFLTRDTIRVRGDGVKDPGKPAEGTPTTALLQGEENASATNLIAETMPRQEGFYDPSVCSISSFRA
jgi:hypothetical protein